MQKWLNFDAYQIQNDKIIHIFIYAYSSTFFFHSMTIFWIYSYMCKKKVDALQWLQNNPKYI